MRYEKLYDACLYLMFLLHQQAIISDADYKIMINDLQKEFNKNQDEIKNLEERITKVEAIWGYV
jgi:wobble nucleotide-excising tRNase